MSDVQINYSAIIPAFNEVESLGEVIDRAEEVLKYRYDLEIIIIDNGSTDATKLLLEQRIVDSKSNRLRFFRKEINTAKAWLSKR
jgi:glycosyltransferase involved in cell wall biosynthesis